ncbi:hypothetical protein OIU76_001134 [Salix suchowensis]|uniref:Uncharacterized protein n=1 Tax=Salix udensis TaxID=889485 RepID=A0AAD6L5G5_9ROSI|nr:hypothetical protein OIU76_001134 [Salix suchowensis]KAJ6435498.1 hypothetical protein OIU84_000649 [Salix udensis]
MKPKSPPPLTICYILRQRIMAHESVGFFLTHCGYSSVIEALSFGLALIMLPYATDQGLIARVFEEKKVGIGVPRDEEDGSFTRNSVAESLWLVNDDKEGPALEIRISVIDA